jgi:putative aldouronate transport system substrate-binding protein
LAAAVVIAALSHRARMQVLAHGGSARISPDARDDPGVRLKIVWMGAPYCPGSYDGTWIQRRLEEAFNIDIKPVFLGFGQKKELYFSGGDVPDMSWEGDPISVQRLAYHGFIAEIPYELILKHAPDYVALMNREAPATWLYSYWDGRNWGLPTLWLDGARASPGAWRMDWLRRVGIDTVPETLDEFHTALKKFVEEDPDGNGRRDTCGMMGQIEWWRCFNEFFGAFGIGAFSWTQRDGKAVWSGTLPEARQALAVLRQWYAEGIIHPDFILSVQDASEQKFLNGKTGYLEGGCWSVRRLDANDPMSLIGRLRALNGPKAEIVPGPLPIGPTGKRGAWCWGGGGNIQVFGAPTMRDPAKVVRLLKMLNELVINEELFVGSKVGKRGLHWDYADRAVGKASGIRLLAPYNLPHAAKREAIVISGDLGEGGFFSPNCGDPGIYCKYRTPEELEFVRKYKLVECRIRDIFMKPDVVPSAGELLADLRNFQETTYAEIMRGEKDLDYFDRFVEEWKKRGGARLTREANELLAARDRIYKSVAVPAGQGM